MHRYASMVKLISLPHLKISILTTSQHRSTSTLGHWDPAGLPRNSSVRGTRTNLRLPRAKHDPQMNLFWARMNVSVKVYRYGWKRKTPRNSRSIWFMLCLAGTLMHLTAKKNRHTEFALLSRWNNTRSSPRERSPWFTSRFSGKSVYATILVEVSKLLPMQTDMFNPKRTRGGKLLGTNLLVSNTFTCTERRVL